MAARKSILVFDSGLGGLTVYREIALARPDADYLYVADDAGFPYGALKETVLIERVVGLMRELIETHHPDLVVIACNTASTIVLPDLRKTFTVPFVGTVPAIKPACAASVTRRVSVLGTEATVQREYTRALIRDYAQDCEVTLVGAKHLATYTEAAVAGMPVSDDDIRQEIAPCFRDGGGQRTDTVVLACTHYPLLIERLQRLSPWPVNFLDPAPAIARRVTSLLDAPSTGGTGSARAIFTSGKPPEKALQRFGIAASRVQTAAAR